MITPDGESDSPTGQVRVYHCGREFFRRLSNSHLPNVLEDEGSDDQPDVLPPKPPQPLRPEEVKLAMQGLSLQRVLSMCRRRLCRVLEADPGSSSRTIAQQQVSEGQADRQHSPVERVRARMSSPLVGTLVVMVWVAACWLGCTAQEPIQRTPSACTAALQNACTFLCAPLPLPAACRGG